MEQKATTISGEIAEVFAHRFVVATASGRILADLGPAGAALVRLEVGDRIELTGEAKASEIKVSKIVQQGREPIEIRHKPKPEPELGRHGSCGDTVDASVALRAVEAEGIRIAGKPRRKPRHFEVSGWDRAGNPVEVHVDFDGTVRKSKPLAHERT